MSTAFLPFSTGTISIVNGQKAVVAAAAAGLANRCKPGDKLKIGQSEYVIGATGAISDAGFELLDNFTGYLSATGAWVAGTIAPPGIAYKIVPGAAWGNVAEANLRLAEISDILRTGTWRSTSSVAIGDGDKTFTVPSILPIQVGARVRGASAASPATHWMEGVVTALTANSMTINIAGAPDRAGSGSRNDWIFNIAGARGAIGAAVAVNGATAVNDVALWDGPAGSAVKSGGSFASLIALHGRGVLTANRTLYVRTSGDGGNNANDGLTAGTAFLTIQKAIDVAAALDTGIYQITIDVGAGSFAGFNQVKRPVGGASNLIITGAGMAQTTVTVPASYCFRFEEGMNAHLQNMKLETTGGTGGCIFASEGASVTFSGIDFGTVVGASAGHILATRMGRVRATGAYTISGSASYHLSAQNQSLGWIGGITITLTGTPAWTTGFVSLTNNSVMVANSVTFVGSATGVRFRATSASVIQSGGVATYFPGDAAGILLTGAQNY